MKPAKVNNILIIKICCLGDIVFITPVISALKKQYPGSKITIVSSDWIKNIFPFLDGVDDVIIFNPYNKNFFSKAMAALGLILKIRKRKIDLGFTTHRNNFFGLILSLSGIKYRLGFSQTKHLNYTAPFENTLHETKRYLEVLKSIDIDSDEPPGLIQKKDKAEIRKELGINENDFLLCLFPFGGVNPGTKMTIKRWELEKYISLVKKLSDSIPSVKILLMEGTQPDENLPVSITDSLPDGIIVKKINDDIISVCNIFTAGDTGPLHIAAALGVSTLAIFGPSDPNLLAPLTYPGNNAINKYIWKKPYCSPCYTPETAIQRENPKYWRGDTFICNTGTHMCIKEISVDEVFNTLSDMIRKLKVTA